LLLGGHDGQHLGGGDHLPLGQEPPQSVVDKIQPFVLGGIQQLEILFDGGSLRGVAEQLIIGHAESRRGVHVVHVLVVDKRAGLANQRIDHVAKVDVLLAVAKLSRHSLDAFVVVPELQMVLVNADLQLQADVLAAYRVRVAFDANDTIGLHRHRNRSACRATLWRHGGERRDFLTKPLLSRGVAARGELPHEGHVVIPAGEVTAATQPQGLIECILKVAMRRLHVAVLMRLANVDAMAFQAVVSE
jgi:hypothetical protein